MIEESSVTINTGSTTTAGFAACQPALGNAGNGMQKTWNQIKLTASNVKPRVSNKLPLLSGNNSNNQSQGKVDEKEKFERRFIDVSNFILTRLYVLTM